MALTKRKTVKTGNYSRRTTTQSSKGTRISTSSKPPGSPTRRTVSTNLKTGSRRTTYTTKLGGGWYRTTSKTFNPVRKVRPKKARVRTGRSSGGEGISFTDILLLPLLPFIWVYNIIRFGISLLFSFWFWVAILSLIIIFS